MKQFVKLFAEETMAALEYEINKYLEENSVNIISISYSTDENLVFREKALICFEKEII